MFTAVCTELSGEMRVSIYHCVSVEMEEISGLTLLGVCRYKADASPRSARPRQHPETSTRIGLSFEAPQRFVCLPPDCLTEWHSDCILTDRLSRCSSGAKVRGGTLACCRRQSISGNIFKSLLFQQIS
jgi:hypothetical protein